MDDAKIVLLDRMAADAKRLHDVLLRGDTKLARLLTSSLMGDIREFEEILRKEPMPKL